MQTTIPRSLEDRGARPVLNWNNTSNAGARGATKQSKSKYRRGSIENLVGLVKLEGMRAGSHALELDLQLSDSLRHDFSTILGKSKRFLCAFPKVCILRLRCLVVG